MSSFRQRFIFINKETEKKMIGKPKNFYVVFAKEDYLQAILDILRVLADPLEKYQAHITVRGPYKNQLAKSTTEGKIPLDAEVCVKGAGAFLENNQNTVFLNCESAAIIKVWQKPDYAKLKPQPHITIYNGKSRIWAERLLKVMTRHNIRFKFHSTELRLLSTGTNQRSFFLHSAFDPKVIRDVAGVSIEPNEIKTMSEDARLQIIDKVCSHLSQLQCNTQTRSENNEVPYQEALLAESVV